MNFPCTSATFLTSSQKTRENPVERINKCLIWIVVVSTLASTAASPAYTGLNVSVRTHTHTYTHTHTRTIASTSLCVHTHTPTHVHARTCWLHVARNLAVDLSVCVRMTHQRNGRAAPKSSPPLAPPPAAATNAHELLCAAHYTIVVRMRDVVFIVVW